MNVTDRDRRDARLLCQEFPVTLPATEGKFTGVAGRLVARQVRWELRSIAHRHDVELELEEVRGWLEIGFFGTFRGDSAGVVAAMEDLDEVRS